MPKKKVKKKVKRKAKKKKKMKENGLYYPDESYRSESEVKRKLALEGQLPPVIEGGQEAKTFKDYATIAIHRSKQAIEFSPSAQGVVKVTIPDDAILNHIVDLHAFNYLTDHERFFQEIEVIMETPRSLISFGGDLVEGLFWGGAGGTEQVGSLDEQRGFMRELWRRTAGRAVIAVPGEHDEKWAAKTGGSPYMDFNELTKGGVYKRGVMKLDLQAGEQVYHGAVAHRFKGSSIYNNLHSVMRFARENEGYDFVLAGHYHNKALGQQPATGREGARLVTYGIGGPYTRGGEYSQRLGYPEQDTKQLYGFALRFNPDEKRIEMDEDIIHANKKWG